MVEIFGFQITLPPFLLVNLLFSYMVWAKFLKEEETGLGLKKIEDLMAVIAIFAFTTTLIVSLAASLLLLARVIHLSSGVFENIISPIEEIVLGLGFIALYALIGSRKEVVGIRDFKSLFESSINIWSAVIGYILAIIVAGLFTGIKYFIEGIFEVSFVLLGILVLAYILVNESIFSSKSSSWHSWNEVTQVNFIDLMKSKKFLFLVGGFFSFFLLFSLLTFPWFGYPDNPDDTNYWVFEPTKADRETYLERRVTIDVNNFGVIGSTIRYIPLYYGEFGINTSEKDDGYPSSGFRIGYNISEGGERILIESFASVREKNRDDLGNTKFPLFVLDEEKETIYLRFNQSSVDDVQSVFFEGYVNQNLSYDEYHYIERVNDECENQTCRAVLQFKNNLDLPVKQSNRYFIHLEHRGIHNTSSCTFKSLNYSTSYNVSNVASECTIHDRYCSLTLRRTDIKENVFDTDFQIEEMFARMVEPVEVAEETHVNVSVKIQC